MKFASVCALNSPIHFFYVKYTMRIIFLSLVILVLPTFSKAQEDRIRKNSISWESGFFSRGLVGLSYSRKFARTSYSLLSADCFAGIGTNGLYTGLGFNFNIGKKITFFVFGLDIKYYQLSLSETFIYKGFIGEGITFNPYLGFSLFANGGLTLKLRGGLMPAFQNGKYSALFPTVGISLGHSF